MAFDPAICLNDVSEDGDINVAGPEKPKNIKRDGGTHHEPDSAKDRDGRGSDDGRSRHFGGRQRTDLSDAAHYIHRRLCRRRIHRRGCARRRRACQQEARAAGGGRKSRRRSIQHCGAPGRRRQAGRLYGSRQHDGARDQRDGAQEDRLFAARRSGPGGDRI
jgi:hypothetical protein